MPTAPTHSARLPASGVAIHAQNRSQSQSNSGIAIHAQNRSQSQSNSGIAIHAQNRSQSHSTLVDVRRFTHISLLAGLGVSSRRRDGRLRRGGCHASLVDLVLRSGLRKVVLIRPHLRIGLVAHSPHRSVERGANSPHRVRTAIRSKRPRIGSRIGHFAAQILGLLVAASPCWVIFRKPWPVSLSSLLRALSFSFAVACWFRISPLLRRPRLAHQAAWRVRQGRRCARTWIGRCRGRG